MEFHANNICIADAFYVSVLKVGKHLHRHIFQSLTHDTHTCAKVGFFEKSPVFEILQIENGLAVRAPNHCQWKLFIDVASDCFEQCVALIKLFRPQFIQQGRPHQINDKHHTIEFCIEKNTRVDFGTHIPPNENFPPGPGTSVSVGWTQRFFSMLVIAGLARKETFVELLNRLQKP